jgi:hypothetical protein
MPLSVSDRANAPELIDAAAEAIGRSSHRAAVFRAIYTGKAVVKTVTELMDATNLSRIRVLDAGKALSDADLVEQIKVDGLTAYKKIAFFQRQRNKILKYANDPKARAKVPTKRRPASAPSTLTRISFDLKAPKRTVAARMITVDDIASFAKVMKVGEPADYIRMPEAKFKQGVAKILGEVGTFNDWGGELRDLSSTRLRIRGKRKAAAFAFKGPGMTGVLTPGKMGKHGDQIQRLMKCPSDVFLVQYWGQVDDSVLDQLKMLASARSYFEQREILYGVIDGSDSARLIKAYPNAFVAGRRR